MTLYGGCISGFGTRRYCADVSFRSENIGMQYCKTKTKRWKNPNFEGPIFTLDEGGMISIAYYGVGVDGEYIAGTWKSAAHRFVSEKNDGRVRWNISHGTDIIDFRDFAERHHCNWEFVVGKDDLLHIVMTSQFCGTFVARMEHIFLSES